MATFVLVHGAMHGGWCWSDVRRSLAARGHDVYTPTLTGQGDRRQGMVPAIGVNTHITDVDDLLWFEDLTDVHLVLHSYAGVLAGPLAERVGHRLASIVFLAAFVTAPGQSLLDVEPPDVAARYRALVNEDGDGWCLPATDQFLGQWGVVDKRLRARVAPRLTDFPFRCQTEATEFDPGPLAGTRKIYVHHTDPPLASLTRFFTAAQRAGWETHQLACGHDVMLTAPEETVTLLELIADGPGTTPDEQAVPH
jgi:pimeloyl-ACP methyl ester carboxylesterase